MGNPVTENPLATRSDVQRAVRQLVAPLEPHHSPGGALVRVGAAGASFPNHEAGIEGYARSLWGVATLAAGGGEFDGWKRYRSGLVNGTDPEHPEYWGTIADGRQKVVEGSCLGMALGLVPEQLWEPLDEAERERVQTWLTAANGEWIPDNNWRFFRVLANVGLSSVEAPFDRQQVATDLDRLETFALDDGWYADGPDAPVDYYCAWTMHVEGLLYAWLAEDDPERAARFRRRAIEFASEYRHLFEPSGRAVPYGRSLTYRFAQAAFWGALALVGRDADLPWGEIRGLWLRNLRWWFDQPIFAADGTLTVGYRYPSQKMTERYNSPSSPYWAFRAFLPLIVDADHPFWTADERPLPELDRQRPIEAADLLVRREPDHVVAFTGGTAAPRYRNKYDKFAYSSHFGFGVDDGIAGLDACGIDSTLVVSTDGEHFRGRTAALDGSVDDGIAASTWDPFDDVTIRTKVLPVGPWHVRIHQLEAARAIETAEGGFALPTTEERYADDVRETTEGQMAAVSFEDFSGLRAVGGGDRCEPAVTTPVPNTNVQHPRTAVPVLSRSFEPGSYRFATAVLGVPGTASPTAWTEPPTVEWTWSGATIGDGEGETRQTVNLEQQ
ncbi:DUF2264 domain-containing protein [Halomicrobium mukohataei]|uniref:DUF2264 domain-containing protein n=1 Tax=Halomicrobium mukohataei TaxID=57705 RepID=A0A847U9R1_9EURY|nr:DUF2264 domain-containing protein [Halomicrobium mukohataei]NLV08977.1 DUF2264 domain-containing protein [Halomicrobium mukohataei]